MPEHTDCWIGECEHGLPDECPKVALDRARDKGRAWGLLETCREVGGLRHYLDGKAVHCGASLELQEIEHKADDYGEYARFLQAGTAVRYDAQWRDGEPRGVLYASVGGHAFAAALEPWMRFRWPKRG